MDLYHGTSENSPSLIIESEEGFDTRKSKKGVWGEAIYFAVNSSYSHKYAFKDYKP